jgi:transposase-like protein
MDETYIKVKGQWKYLYRAVDTAGQTIDFLLTAKRDGVVSGKPPKFCGCGHSA